MDPSDIKSLLRAVAAGKMRVPEAVARLQHLPFENLGYARIDHHRQLRRGFPEAVYGEGKSPEQCAEIVGRIARVGAAALVTRATRAQFRRIHREHRKAQWHDAARMIVLLPAGRADRQPAGERSGKAAPRALRGGARAPRAGREEVLVVTAGTSDIPVAEEAALTAEVLGATVGRLYDVGVAGLHRLLEARARLDAARVIVVVAGMEGALPSVVAGLVSAPVIGVPTSVGYGAAFGGITALLGMLTSCAGGLTVVNIDNGFGAAVAAVLIVRGGKQ